MALRRVLEDAEKSGADEYVFLGDLVNDFPMGNETLELVKSKTNYVLRGNKEQYLIELEDEGYNWPNVQFKNALFMHDELTDENKEYIRNLPISMRLEFDGFKILFCHGSPNSVEELMYVDDNEVLADGDAVYRLLKHNRNLAFRDHRRRVGLNIAKNAAFFDLFELKFVDIARNGGLRYAETFRVQKFDKLILPADVILFD